MSAFWVKILISLWLSGTVLWKIRVEEFIFCSFVNQISSNLFATSAIAYRAPCSLMRYSIVTVAMPKETGSIWTLLGECCKPNKLLTRRRDAG